MLHRAWIAEDYQLGSSPFEDLLSLASPSANPTQRLPDSKMPTQNNSTTFTYRRWRNDSGYVDTQNKPLAKLERSVATSMASLPRPSLPLFDPADPPTNGSTPFLNIPTELRLQIYGYLTVHKETVQETIARQLPRANNTSSASSTTNSAYLYRSPGRIKHHETVTKPVRLLFHINRQIRAELIDSCFSDRTFVLEASLYRSGLGGLNVLPRQLGPVAWVKRLLLITTIDRDTALVKGIADLRGLQLMTNLRDLRIVLYASAGTKVDLNHTANNPVRAVLECVPRWTKVTFGAEGPLRDEILRELGASVDYLFKGDTTVIEEAYGSLRNSLTTLARGSLSGSSVNHGACEFPACQEQHLGTYCVNAQTPGAPRYQEPPDSRLSRYFRGCEIKSVEPGLHGHLDCPKMMHRLRHC